MPWDLLLTLPNIVPPVPTPFESSGVVICSAGDDRLHDLEDNPGNAAALRMLDSFRTARGIRYQPGCLLIRTDAQRETRVAAALRSFRNVCAIATTTRAWAAGVASPQRAQWTVLWSDQFLFGYFTPGRNGWLQTLDGAARGMDDAIPESQPAAQFLNPRDWNVRVDGPLLNRLLTCWRRHYLTRSKDRRALRRLFRSLEVAFHASLFPADGLTSLNDVGTRLALWVSAFEVLCHPGTRSVTKRDVQRMLRTAPYEAMELTTTRYTVSYGGVRHRATLPEALYDDLYWARNQFLHGMPVGVTTLHYRHSRSYSQLIRVAPILYNAALLSFLGQIRIAGGPMVQLALGDRGRGLARYMESREGLREVQEGLIAASYPIDEHGVPQLPRNRARRP
jgi:hypothetical protein